MGNSSYTLQALVDIARSMGDCAPTLPTGGAYETVATSAANDVMTAMVAGSSKGSPFNFKWNRVVVTPFYINSWQQDYASANVNIGWLESCGAYNTSSNQSPKQFVPIEVKRDVLTVSGQSSYANTAKCQWMQNDSLNYGTWGQSVLNSTTGIPNPGPGTTYGNPQGAISLPANPITQVKDSFGNLWMVTGYGTCGAVNPFLVNANPVFPDINNPSTVATTVADGSVTWTAVNPKGQGFRISPQPAQTSPVWQVCPIAQAKIAKITSLGQFLEPIPDDYFTYFQNGFFAQCYRRSPDPKVRSKFKDEWAIFMESLDESVDQGSREADDFGFVPSYNVMDTGWSYNPVNPAMPYGPVGLVVVQSGAEDCQLVPTNKWMLCMELNVQVSP